MHDEIVLSLANVLSGNIRLRELALTPCTRGGVTTASWGAFTAALRNPYSALEKLDLINNDSITDHVIDSFAESLANNNKIRIDGLPLNCLP